MARLYKSLILSICGLLLVGNVWAAPLAKRIRFTPAGTIAATNVQDAVEEVADEALSEEADPLAILKDGSILLTADWNAGEFKVTAGTFELTQTTFDPMTWTFPATGTENSPALFIDDNRTGTTANEKGEATLVIDAEGTFSLYTHRSIITDGDIHCGSMYTAGNLAVYDNYGIWLGATQYNSGLVWNTNGAGDDFTHFYTNIPTAATDTAAYFFVNSAVSGMTDHDDYKNPTLILANVEGADTNDYAGVVIGERANADVAVAHYFDFYAITGSLDGSVDATTTELAPIFRFSDDGSSTPGSATCPGCVYSKLALEVDGMFYPDGGITVTDDDWIGLGAAKGRIEFEDEAADNINLLGANVGIGTDAPGADLEIYSGTPAVRIRDTHTTASATTAFLEFGGTTAAAWDRTGYVGDASSGDTDIFLVAEDSDLYLGDSSSVTAVTLSAGKLSIASLTASEIVITDASKNLVSAAVATYPSLAELANVKGATSGIQEQIDGKEATVTEGSLTDSVIVSADIKDGVIAEADLDIANSPTDEYVLSYESDTSNFQWVAAGAGGGATHREYTFLPHTAGFDPTNPAEVDWVASSGTGLMRFPRAKFDDGENDTQHYTFIMPSDATASADLILDVHWFSDEDVAEDVVWGVQISASTPNADGSVLTQAADTVDTVTDSADSVGVNAPLKATITIDYANCDGAVAGDEIDFIFYRVGADGSDTHTNEVYLRRLHLKIPRS